MANSASAPSKYEEMVVSKTVKVTDKRSNTYSLRGKVTSFSYYESLYSPATTASVTYTESTESTKNLEEISGYENFGFKIQSKYGTLSFNRKKVMQE